MKLRTYLSGIAVLLAAGAALAQPVYRIVGPNGKVTFSDQPPAANAQAGSAAPAAALPGAPGRGRSCRTNCGRWRSATRSRSTPATDCGPCGAGRSLLVTAGSPSPNGPSSSNEDIEALQRLSGQASLPLLYHRRRSSSRASRMPNGRSTSTRPAIPRASQLPPSYRNPPAQPLVAVQAAPAAQREAPAPSAAPPVPPPQPADAEQPGRHQVLSGFPFSRN